MGPFQVQAWLHFTGGNKKFIRFLSYCALGKCFLRTSSFLDRIQFDPLLHSSRRELMKRMPAGDLTKVIVTYKEVR